MLGLWIERYLGALLFGFVAQEDIRDGFSLSSWRILTKLLVYIQTTAESFEQSKSTHFNKSIGNAFC